MPTSADIAILNQSNLTYRIRLDLLDDNLIKIGELEGDALSLSYSSTAESDIRSTISLSMYVADEHYLVESQSKVWLDRLVRVYFGLDDHEEETHWYLLGSYLMSENSYTFNAESQELSISLVDMMAALTSVRGSQIGGYGLLIPEGSNVRNAINSTVAQFSPYKFYDVPEFPDTIPYDLEFSSGSYPYDVLKGILSLFPTYEMLYSPESVFTVREIPTGIGDAVYVDKNLLDPLIISEHRTSRFSDVRNTTELLGLSLDAGYTASSCVTTGSRYDVFIADTFDVLEEGATYGFTPDANSKSGQTLKIQDTTPYPLVKRSGAGVQSPIAVNEMQTGIPYVVRYTSGNFVLEGELEIRVIVQEVNTALSQSQQTKYKNDNDCRYVQWVINPDSPFAADRIGEIKQVLADGEYSDIPTVNLAFERAKYENWQKTRLQDRVDLQAVLIPWMKVNVKVDYTSPLTGDVDQYLVQSLNWSLDVNNFQMNLGLIKFYPVYPW